MKLYGEPIIRHDDNFWYDVAGVSSLIVVVCLVVACVAHFAFGT